MRLASQQERAIRVEYIFLTFITPMRLNPFRDPGMERLFVTPEALVNLVSRMSSKYRLTSVRYAINVREEARKRVSSKADGIGAGSRKGISKEVQADGDDVGGILPRRAKSCHLGS
jgi:hypothetical protein